MLFWGQTGHGKGLGKLLGSSETYGKAIPFTHVGMLDKKKKKLINFHLIVLPKRS